VTSEELTELALRAGTDEDALNELIACEVDYVTGWVSRNVGGRYRNDIEDISQEILICIANGIPGFKGKSSYARWCGSLMSKRLMDWLRKASRRTLAYEDLYANMDVIGDTYETVSELESEEEFHALLMLAPFHTRESLRRVYVDGYSIAEAFRMQDRFSAYEGFRSERRRAIEGIKTKILTKRGKTP